MLIFVSNCSVLSEISIFRRNFQMVTCTADCTCHHETNLARVNYFNNICLKNEVAKRIRHDSLEVEISNAIPIFCGSLLILLFFFKIFQMVICPVTGTYNHAKIFLCSRMKKAFKLASRASF